MKVLLVSDVEKELLVGSLEIAIAECEDQKGEGPAKLASGFRELYKKIAGKDFVY